MCWADDDAERLFDNITEKNLAVMIRWKQLASRESTSEMVMVALKSYHDSRPQVVLKST